MCKPFSLIQCRVVLIFKTRYGYDSGYDMTVAWTMTMAMTSIRSDESKGQVGQCEGASHVIQLKVFLIEKNLMTMTLIVA